MQLGRIEIFPIKSLDGVSVERARITAGGILANDRVYALLDGDGRYLNGKRTPRVHDIRCVFDAGFKEVRLWRNGESSPAQFALDQPARLNGWLSDFFGFPVTVRHEAEKGFPDDTVAYGPTIVGEASLRRIRDWYPGLTLESVRRRFRANLELTGGEAFAEDRLYGPTHELTPFQIGPVRFLGHNPCQRCVVPTRDPVSGAATPDFQKQFMKRREEQLPPWANAERFNHFYRFAVNTSIPASEAGKWLRVGDELAFA